MFLEEAGELYFSFYPPNQMWQEFQPNSRKISKKLVRPIFDYKLSKNNHFREIECMKMRIRSTRNRKEPSKFSRIK